MSHLQSAAVFCGSAPGNHPAYLAAAAELGRGFAANGIRLVYGGGGIGLMGAVSQATHDAGGAVLGIMPDFLKRREIPQIAGTELVVTTSMHARKAKMFEAADAFVILPGGLGTLDEMFEIITWRQLGLHDKPILICNINHAADLWIAVIENAVATGFAQASALTLYEQHTSVAAVLARLCALPPSPVTESTRL